MKKSFYLLIVAMLPLFGFSQKHSNTLTVVGNSMNVYVDYYYSDGTSDLNVYQGHDANHVTFRGQEHKSGYIKIFVGSYQATAHSINYPGTINIVSQIVSYNKVYYNSYITIPFNATGSTFNMIVMMENVFVPGGK